MGLFVKRHNAGEHAALYTLGSSRTVLVVGLGNIGTEYEKTRHNLGFSCLDYYAKRHEFPNWHEKKDLKCLITSLTIGSTRMILAKPTTLMNLSGQAVGLISNFYKVPLSNTLIIHDELDLDFGVIKTKLGGGSAGHNGLKSIISQVGEEFARLRIGIGRPQQQDPTSFVLDRFTKEEEVNLLDLKKETTSLIDEFAAGDELIPQSRHFVLTK
jgi:peptidyl-tRNA hydrolase, PTH1 family